MLKFLGIGLLLSGTAGIGFGKARELDQRVEELRMLRQLIMLLAFANVTIGGCFKIDGFRICSSEKGLYVNMPATQDKGGNWKDVCWPVTAEFRK